jgi:opacity protein-like surface antigen
MYIFFKNHLKRYFFLCALMIPIISVAQENYFNKPRSDGSQRFIHGGIVGGINASQLDGDNYSGFHKAGLNIGFTAFRSIAPKWLLNLELLYSQKGVRNIQMYNSPAVGSVPIEYKASLNYVEIPLMIHYDVGEKIFLGAGVSYSRLISDKELMDSYTSATTSYLENTFKKEDLNYLFGVSYQLYEGLFVRARYQYSINSVRSYPNIPQPFTAMKQFNNLFALQVMYIF